MNFGLARRLVWKALRLALPTLTFTLVENDSLTLYAIGLQTTAERARLKALLVSEVIEAGYEIDPAMIPTGATDTPMMLASALSGNSTKGNKP